MASKKKSKSKMNERAKARTDYEPSLAKAFPVPVDEKYLVVSLDSDEGQWFYDFVYAESAEAAKQRIMKLRPYTQWMRTCRRYMSRSPISSTSSGQRVRRP
jgi:hypothetical protein